MKHTYLFIMAATCALSTLQSQAQAPVVTLTQTWATDTVLKTPESVLYDAKRGLVYVSNINKVNDQKPDGDGFITKINPKGTIDQLEWVKGLNDPKGMAIVNNTLFVSDVKQLVEIDVLKGTIVKKHDVAGAEFLNDVAASEEGEVYITDSKTNKVFKYSKGFVSLWLDAKGQDKLNGVLVEKDTVFLAAMNAGTVGKVTTKTTAIKPWVSGIPKPDGITGDGEGNYFISNWDGEVYYVTAKGEKALVLDTKDKKIQSADIEYAGKFRTLYVPTFFGNKVVAYRVTIK